MPGSREQGLRAAKTMRERDPDHYRKIALLSQEAWVRNGKKPRGFATMDKERLSKLATKGGKRGRKPKKVEGV